MDEPSSVAVLVGAIATLVGAVALVVKALAKQLGGDGKSQASQVDQSGTYPAVLQQQGYPPAPGVSADRQTLEHMVSRFEAVMERAEQPATHADVEAMRGDLNRLTERVEGALTQVEENARGVVFNRGVNSRQDTELTEHARRLDKLELH